MSTKLTPALTGLADRATEPALGLCSAGLLIASGAAAGSDDGIMALLFWALAAGFAVFVGLFALHVWTNRRLIGELELQRQESIAVRTKLGELVTSQNNTVAATERVVGQLLNATNSHAERSMTGHEAIEVRLAQIMAQFEQSQSLLSKAIATLVEKMTNGK